MVHRIAVPVEAGLVAADFNKTSHIHFYDIEENQIVKEQMSVFPTENESVMPIFLAENSVNEVILGQPQESEINTFLASRISVVIGAPVMNPREVVEDYLFQMQHQHHHHSHGGCGCGSGTCETDSEYEEGCGCDSDCGCH